ncbi:MAG TPA: ABC transporter substrate-binding protein, partial [Thermosynergistes sp.]|nr:ABC transporter substrate-binding protein [Thermosynergistes sp.]
PFIANSLGQLYIFPEHIWSKVLEERGPKGTLEWDNAQAIGSGPFKLGYWRRDEEMKLVRNDDYFQPAKVDAIIKIPYANVQGLVAGLTTGEIDVLGWWLEPIQADKLKDVEGISVIEVPDHGYYHINVNMRRTPFDDKAVRFALSYAIPRQKIIDILLEGHGTKEGSIIASANSFWYNPAIKPLPYDLDKARQILKEAGYEWDAKGKIYYPEGKVERFKK